MMKNMPVASTTGTDVWPEPDAAPTGVSAQAAEEAKPLASTKADPTRDVYPNFTSIPFLHVQKIESTRATTFIYIFHLANWMPGR